MILSTLLWAVLGAVTGFLGALLQPRLPFRTGGLAISSLSRSSRPPIRLPELEGPSCWSADQAPELPEESQILAIDFFSNPFFYGGNARVVELFAKKREDLLQMKTAQEVLSLKSGDEAILFFNEMGVMPMAVLPFLTSIEDRLAGEIVPLNCRDEIELAARRCFALNSTEKLLAEASAMQKSKELDILKVFGSRGSGKTQLCLRAAAGKDQCAPWTTWYLKVTEIKDVAFVDEIDPQVLVAWIQDKLVSNHPAYDPEKKLNLHVSLILDDVGSTSLGHFLQVDGNLSALYNLMLERVAESFRLIVCYAEVTTKQSASEEFAKIRMEKWSQEDFTIVALNKSSKGTQQVACRASSASFPPS
jgi:hypothetical protein